MRRQAAILALALAAATLAAACTHGSDAVGPADAAPASIRLSAADSSALILVHDAIARLAPALVSLPGDALAARLRGVAASVEWGDRDGALRALGGVELALNAPASADDADLAALRLELADVRLLLATPPADGTAAP